MWRESGKKWSTSRPTRGSRAVPSSLHHHWQSAADGEILLWKAGSPSQLAHALRDLLRFQIAVHELFLPQKRGNNKFGNSGCLISVLRIISQAVARIDVDWKRTSQFQIHIIPMPFDVTVRVTFFLIFFNLFLRNINQRKFCSNGKIYSQPEPAEGQAHRHDEKPLHSSRAVSIFLGL